MSISRGCLAIALVGWLSSAASAQSADWIALSTFKGFDLAGICTGEATAAEVRIDPCNSYILGAVDALQLSGQICVDQGAYTVKTVALVRKYLKDHPESWSLHPVVIVRAALTPHYPCRK